MTDARLLLNLQKCSPEALTALMEKYESYVYTVISNTIGNAGTPQDIEELVQDSFYAVWTHSESICVNLKAYLRTTARNKAKTWLRGKKELPMSLDFIDIPYDGDLEDKAIQADISRILQQAIAQMKSKDREIFLRYYFYLQTTTEISEEMGLPVGTISSRLSRGRNSLKKKLRKEILS